MNDGFSSNTNEDRELEDAKLRRRKIHENAAPVKKPILPIIVNIIIITVIFVVIGSFAFIFAAPEKVVNKWPQTTAFYEKVGIFVYPDNFKPGPNVEIKPYASTMVADGGVYKLTIAGHIINRGQHNVVIPQIIGTLLDASQNEIYTWSFCLPNRTLVRGQGVDYEYEIMAAPAATATAVVEIKWEKDAGGNVIDTCPPIDG